MDQATETNHSLVIPESSTSITTSTTAVTPQTNVVTSNHNIPDSLFMANRPVIILGDSVLANMFGQARNMCIPQSLHSPFNLLSLPPDITLVSEHTTAQAVPTSGTTLALPSTSCFKQDEISPNIEVGTLPPESNTNESSPRDTNTHIEDDVIPESPQVSVIPDSPVSDDTLDSVCIQPDSVIHATSNDSSSPSVSQSKIDLPNPFVVEPQKIGYGENILNALTASILSLSDETKATHTVDDCESLVSQCSKLQDDGFKTEPLSQPLLEPSIKLQKSPYIGCIEEREDLLDESDNELEMPELCGEVTVQNNALDTHNNTSASIAEERVTEISEETTTGTPLPVILEPIPGTHRSSLNEQTFLQRSPVETSDNPAIGEQTPKQRQSQDCLLSDDVSLLEPKPVIAKQNLDVSDQLDQTSSMIIDQPCTLAPTQVPSLPEDESNTTVSMSLDLDMSEPLPKKPRLEMEEDLEPVSNETILLDSNQDVSSQLPSNVQELYSQPKSEEKQDATKLKPTNIDKQISLPELGLEPSYPHAPFDGADTGSDTIDQALPIECARQHALVPNMAKCARDIEQDSDDSDSDDEDEFGQAVGYGGSLPGIEDHAREEFIGDENHDRSNVHQTELARQFVPEYQIVPDEISLDSSFSSKSMYSDEQKDKQQNGTDLGLLNTLEDVDIENMDDTTVLTLALETIESRKTSTTTQTACQDSDVSTAYTPKVRASYRDDPRQNCFTFKHQQGHVSELCPTTRLNLSKPKLRLGLSRKAKPNSLRMLHQHK